MKISPKGHFLESIRATPISAREAICELVDNSYDAGAASVWVNYDAERITVRDDGSGCADLRSMLTLGEHAPHKTTKLGRYGVGLKNASIGMGDVATIVTIRGGIERRAEINWPSVIEHDFETQDPTERPSKSKPGTTITLWLNRRIQTHRLERDLAYAFAPAILAGRDLYLNDSKVAAWIAPHGSKVLRIEDTHPSGFSYAATASITKLNPLRPFILAYDHRIIGDTSEPCGDYNTNGKFICVVELKDSPAAVAGSQEGRWPLLKHKDGVRDSDEAEWLYASLLRNCEPLLAELEKAGEALELKELSYELNDAYSVITGRPKRPNTWGEKREDPKTTGPRRVRVATVVDGTDDGDAEERESKKPLSGIIVSYAAMDADKIGRVDPNGKRMCVQLNELHPFILSARRTNPECIKAIAVSLLSDHLATISMGYTPGQSPMRYESETHHDRFIEGVSRFLNCLATSNPAVEALTA